MAPEHTGRISALLAGGGVTHRSPPQLRKVCQEQHVGQRTQAARGWSQSPGCDEWHPEPPGQVEVSGYLLYFSFNLS